MKTNLREVNIGVTRLVDFACRTGDLTYDIESSPTALAGQKAHRLLQQQAPSNSLVEHHVKATLQIEQVSFQLSGRVDIVHPQQALLPTPCLEEIKTTHTDPKLLPESLKAQQKAQLKIYAYCYQQQTLPHAEEDEHCTLVLTWFDLLANKISQETWTESWRSLMTFTRDAVARFAVWEAQVYQQKQHTLATAKTLSFPFGVFREGQRLLAVETFRAIKEQTTLLAEAPTGIGKTISTIFPSIKAYGESLTDKIVYLTAKTAGQAAADEAIEKLKISGLDITVLTLTARRKVCPCLNDECERSEQGVCPRTIGFFDRLPDARAALLQAKTMNLTSIQQTANTHQLCPFQLAIQMLPWATVVICDLNYVFDPLVSLTYFKETNEKISLLIDEAHNLSDRAREMYSGSATLSSYKNALMLCDKKHHAKLWRAIKKPINQLQQFGLKTAIYRSVDIATEAQHNDLKSFLNEFSEHLSHIIELAGLTNSDADVPNLPAAMNEWLKDVYRYLAIEAQLIESHYTICHAERKDQLSIKWFCADPSKLIQKTLKQFQSVILFSATLSPTSYFLRTLGLPNKTKQLTLRSPFPTSHLGVFHCPQVDTRFKQRSQYYDIIVQIIHASYIAKPGNHLVFFPSYDYLERVADLFKQAHPDIRILKQQADWDDGERLVFRSTFKTEHNILAFAILGGIFAEGIDYRGDQLIGCVIVGVGLPQLNQENDIIKKQFDTEGSLGFDIAYRLPGFVKVLQTAGRVIRQSSDKGTVILIDQRYQSTFYRNLFPAHWQISKCTNLTDLTRALHTFWQAATEN